MASERRRMPSLTSVASVSRRGHGLLVGSVVAGQLPQALVQIRESVLQFGQWCLRAPQPVKSEEALASAAARARVCSYSAFEAARVCCRGRRGSTSVALGHDAAICEVNEPDHTISIGNCLHLRKPERDRQARKARPSRSVRAAAVASKVDATGGHRFTAQGPEVNGAE